MKDENFGRRVMSAYTLFMWVLMLTLCENENVGTFQLAEGEDSLVGEY